MPGLAGQSFGGSTPTVFEMDLVAYLQDALEMPVYAPLKRGLKFRGPVNVPGDGPFLTVARIDDDRDQVLSGPSGLVMAEFQIDLFGQINDDVLILGERLRYALNGFRGPMGPTEVQNCTLLGQPNAWLENEDPKKPGVYRQINEYQITYRESVRDFGAG